MLHGGVCGNSSFLWSYSMVEFVEQCQTPIYLGYFSGGKKLIYRLK
jgi:hypothetical protein